MKFMRKLNYLSIACLSLFTGTLMFCKKPYEPKLTSSTTNILVVEGHINAGGDSTYIALSRTILIDKSNAVKKETGATVTIESNTNEVYALKEETPGLYNAPPIALSTTRKYRLRIKTGGSNYVSDYVEVKSSPPIEVNWEVSGDGIQIDLNSTDPANSTKYYRWESFQTFEFTTPYNSRFIWDYTLLDVRLRTPDEMGFICWTSINSPDIKLGSTAKQTTDVIEKEHIVYIPSTSERISRRYSVLVKQYALTKEAYEFWENMKKNTETLGSIFDAQPSEIAGNIHSETNPDEPVIGYISV
ncbi:MAG: DUF4249 domain-containing protein, partial [Pedobacter sp.]